MPPTKFERLQVKARRPTRPEAATWLVVQAARLLSHSLAGGPPAPRSYPLTGFSITRFHRAGTPRYAA